MTSSSPLRLVLSLTAISVLLLVCVEATTGAVCDAADPGCPSFYATKDNDPGTASCQLYNPDGSSSASVPCMGVPSYATLKSLGKLWDCPALDDLKDTWHVFQNAPKDSPVGTGGYALCPGAYQKSQCCMPPKGCYPMNGFNWVLGACKGRSCGDGGQSGEYNKWKTGGFPNHCKDAPAAVAKCHTQCGSNSTCFHNCLAAGGWAYPSKCTNGTTGLCTLSGDGAPINCIDMNVVRDQILARDNGTAGLINYIAAYSYNPSTDKWEKRPKSSFNTYGHFGPYNVTAPNGGHPNASSAWMPGPQPGGAADWGWGYYPAGVGADVGPPGMMFVMSAEATWNLAWYVLNQATLDRGPAVGHSFCPNGDNANTWACANSLELDILESSWAVVGAGDGPAYDNFYQTTSNEGNAGRSLWPSYGMKYPVGIGGFGSPCHLKGSHAEPQVWVAVADRVGFHSYQIPAASVASIWPGLTRTTAADTLPGRPTRAPLTAPCASASEFCASFNPNSQATSTAELGAQSGFAPSDKGFCGNYFVDGTTWVDTKQQWGSTPATLGGKTMPWNAEMECGQGGGR